jgi:hypothetical protein
VKPVDVSGIKSGNICKTKLMIFQRTKNKSIRDLYSGIHEFKRGYQQRNSLREDENGDLLADPQNILNRWKN